MKGGDLNYFLNQVFDGEEVFFKVYGKHYLYQGFYQDELYHRVLECFNEDPKLKDKDGYIWHYTSATGFEELYDAFLSAKLFNGKTLMEAEPDLEWTDDEFRTYEDYVPPKGD